MSHVRAETADGPAHYRWSSYQHNALRQRNRLVPLHPPVCALAAGDKTWESAYRRLFRLGLDDEAISDISLASTQNPSRGNPRFYAKLEAMTRSRSAGAGQEGQATRRRPRVLGRVICRFESLAPGP